MKKGFSEGAISQLVFKVLKIIAFIAGGFLFYRSRKKLMEIAKNQNFIITAAYAVILAFIALFYRLIMVLNWIIQQGH
jgi:hypothetical protein